MLSGDPRYVDCTAVRGNEDVVSQMFEVIDWTETVTHQLFTGHRGCGKSTELLRLQSRLQKANYNVIFFKADDDLDLNDIEYSDILIAIAKRVHSGLEEQGIKLDEKLLDNVLLWLAEVIYEQGDLREIKTGLEAEFGLGVPAVLSPLAQMLAKVTGQIKTSHETKRHIRCKLDPQISQLTEHINLLLYAARSRIQQSGYRDLVLIIDNLDRITHTAKKDQRDSHEAIYIEFGDQLCNLACHVIYTVPMSMLYSPNAFILTNMFPNNFLLPLIKTHERSGAVSREGLETLRAILARRIDLDTLFEDEAVEHLCKVCGGHVRDLMRLVRYACRYADSARFPKPITLEAARKAEENLINMYSRMIPEEHFPLLARVHLRKEVKNDEIHRWMLYNLSVLEYYDGAPPWYDVHPAVIKLPKFQEALAHERPNLIR